jgi:amino acid transporter
MTSPAQQTLERRLGPLDGAAIIVSNVIGGTILFAPPFMAGLVPNPWLYLGLWVAGGALAFAGAMAYAELAALRPKAGGEYVYLDAAYGRVAAFLTGWTSFVAGFSGANRGELLSSFRSTSRASCRASTTRRRSSPSRCRMCR